jgi:hypothetical protein
MTFSYNNTLADNRSKVRFYLGDTVENLGPRVNNANFSDEELDAILTEQGDDVTKVVASLFDVLATDWAKFAISYTVGPRREELFRITTRFESKSKEWSSLAGTSSTNFSGGFVRRDSDVNSGSVT